MTGPTPSARPRLQPPDFGRFEDAYTAVLEDLLCRPGHRVDSRGNPGQESLNISFTLTDPAQRLITNPARRFNPVFGWAEFLWYTAGRADLDMIGYYAPSLASYSADGHALTGSAYGPKLFAPAPSGRSQWDRVVDLLQTDPDSKRAVAAVFDPGELVQPGNPDVSCTLSLQFLLRGGALHLVTVMRGNDAVLGLACDVHAFTLIQEFTALQLGVGLGSYTHHVASMHINDATAGWAAAIVESARTRPVGALFPVPPMPATTSWSTLAAVRAYEQDLRTNQRQITRSDLGWLDLDPYWEQVVLLFELYRQIRHQPGPGVQGWVLEALDPGHRWLATHRWPEPTGSITSVAEQAAHEGGRR
jgi:thymidylate synthase